MYDSFILPINHTTFLTLREVKRDFEGLRSLFGSWRVRSRSAT